MFRFIISIACIIGTFSAAVRSECAEGASLIRACEDLLTRGQLRITVLKGNGAGVDEISALRSMSSAKHRIYAVARFMSLEPKNSKLHEIFANSVQELIGSEKNFKAASFKTVVEAYDLFSPQQVGQGPNREHVAVLVDALKQSQGGMRGGTLLSSGIVQEFFADLIAFHLRLDPTYSVRQAMDFVAWLKNHGIGFSRYPGAWSLTRQGGHPAKWFLGSLYRAVVLGGKDATEILKAIEQEFESHAPGFEKKVDYLVGLRSYMTQFKLPDEALKLIAARIVDWIQSPETFQYSDLSAMKTKSDPLVSQAFEFAARTVGFREFLVQAVNSKMHGYLLGFSGHFYSGISDLSGLQSFITTYHRLLMSARLYLNSEAKVRRKIRRFMRYIVASGKPIVFLLPSSFENSIYTRAEFEYLMEDPQHRLRNVTFVLGAVPIQESD